MPRGTAPLGVVPRARRCSGAPGLKAWRRSGITRRPACGLHRLAAAAAEFKPQCLAWAQGHIQLRYGCCRAGQRLPLKPLQQHGTDEHHLGHGEVLADEPAESADGTPQRRLHVRFTPREWGRYQRV